MAIIQRLEKICTYINVYYEQQKQQQKSINFILKCLQGFLPQKTEVLSEAED